MIKTQPVYVEEEEKAMRFVDPKNDVAFKKIFGDEQHKEILDDLEVYAYWSMKLQDERGAITVAEQCGKNAGVMPKSSRWRTLCWPMAWIAQ